MIPASSESPAAESPASASGVGRDAHRHDRAIVLGVYGVSARILCDDDDVVQRIEKDFHFFLRPDEGAAAELTIEAVRRPPDYASLPDLTASVHTPRNICYTTGDVTYLDYHGRALGEYHRSSERLRVVADDPNLLHEIVFLALLSRVGELLERRGMHRIHALAVAHPGVAKGGRAVEEASLFLMDSGGGKTTLGLGFLLEEGPFRLVSEDSPLVKRDGSILPFPLRIGLLPPLPEGIPPEHVTRIERMEFDPKLLVSLEAFPGRIASGRFLPNRLFIGRRRLGMRCEIRRVSRWTGWKSLVRQMIVGVGLYQGLEFLLRSSPLDLARHTGIVASRALAAVRLLLRCKVYVVELGRDRAENLRVVKDFLAPSSEAAGS